MLKYLLLFCILLFQSCNSLEGELYSYRPYSLVDIHNNEIQLKPGLTPVELELNSKQLFSLKSSDHVFKFTIPYGQTLPKESGEIKLTSEQVGQDYGLYAKIRTNIFKGKLIRDQEDCSWVERFHTCDDSGVCRTEYRTRSGLKDVSFRYTTYEKKIVLNLNVDQSGEIVSQFLGDKTYVKKVYSYESSCY